jgi:uncharacterized protein
MGRVVVIIILVVIAVWLIRRALARSMKPPPEGKTPVESDLVPCARCGVNLPRAEAREAGGRLFCSDEHARLGQS